MKYIKSNFKYNSAWGEMNYDEKLMQPVMFLPFDYYTFNTKRKYAFITLCCDFRKYEELLFWRNIQVV